MADREITFDLDAAIVEQARVIRTVRFKGRDWSFPWSPPIVFASYLAKGDVVEAVTALLGDEAEKFLASGIEIDDLMMIFERVYGMAAGE